MNFINCTVIKEDETVICGNITYLAEDRLDYTDELFWIYLGIYIALVLTAGLMSGLTMGLLSLDVMTLKIMKDGGSPKERKQAEKILPIVKRHHLLLVTLLLANAAAVESMPIFLDRVSDPIIAILVSVTAVLIFGEVVPQAICTRYGLSIGAALAPVVYVLMGLFFVIAWPISKLLDCLLGTEHGTFYRRAQLKVLVDLHADTPHVEHGSAPEAGESLTLDEVLIIKGALDMKSKIIKDAMLPLDDVFMLDIESKMDHATMKSIVDMTHSRIPVYEKERTNIISVLLVKRLISLDPDDATPVRSLVGTGSATSVLCVEDDMPLYDLLNLFQTGKGHLAIVQKSSPQVIRFTDEDDPCILVTTAEPNINSYSDVAPGSVIGIITLEDVIEELIQEEIIDETDVYIDIHKRIEVAKALKRKPQMGQRQLSNRSTTDHQEDGSILNLPKNKSPQRSISRTSGIETTDETVALLQD